ncbi:MAG TPA: hypothetical protein DCM14_07035 [Clostridiales bacterium UBA8153]|nr:hypothetical protein [Clostridiales bacterium UBA8153]
MRKVLERCPSCAGQMDVTRMRCRDCFTQVESVYSCCPYCRLSPANAELLRVFVRSRGNIKEIERELGIPYSSARSRLDDLIAELEAGAMPLVARDASPRKVLEALARGDIGASVAWRLLEKTTN